MATYVLVHGGGHGGWCYQPRRRRLGGLEADRHPWRCFERPLTLTDEAAYLAIPQYHIGSDGTIVTNSHVIEDAAGGRAPSSRPSTAPSPWAAAATSRSASRPPASSPA